VDDHPLFTVDDYEAAARGRLGEAALAYLAGGAGDERTVEANRTAFDRWRLLPRVLRGVGDPDTSATVLGSPVASPVLIGPWAQQGLADPGAEEATARAAAASGTIMVVSATVLDRLEAIAATGAPLWWQQYVFTDRGVTADLLARAASAGYRAVVWTVDAPVLGSRPGERRAGSPPPIGAPGTTHLLDASLTWDDMAWVRDAAGGLPVVVKGILRGDDARLAVEHGADAIVVSNHGGRQLDGAIASIDALPVVADEVAGRVPVLVDGGIRRGSDVLTALALGAAAVLVARPIAWGLTVGGQTGVEDVLGIYRDELANVMAQCGARTVADVTRDLVGG
jgi:4-hydroxymandelate oxidase